MKLRPYQDDLIQAVLNAYLDGQQRVLAILATGGGKTVTATTLAQLICPPGKGKRVLWLVHTKELAYQAYHDFQSHYTKNQVGMVQAEYNHIGCQVIVAVVDTLAIAKRRRKVLEFGLFDLIIVDEAHHSLAPGYLAVVKACIASHGLIVGITATGYRSDNQSLGQFYTLVYAKGMLELMAETNPDTGYPYLADLRGIIVKTKVDISTIESEDGKEFDEEALWHAVQKDEQRYQKAVEAYKKWGEDKPFILFAVNVADSEKFVEAFNAQGIPAIGVYGHTHPDERERIMSNKMRRSIGAFEQGQYRILCNVGVLTEGVDLPFVGGIMIARLCRFGGLYQQIVGRVTRICLKHPLLTEPKVYGIVIDLADNDHSVFTLNKLIGSMTPQVASMRKAIQEKREKDKQEEEPFWRNVTQSLSAYTLKGTTRDLYAPEQKGKWQLDAQTNTVRFHHADGTYEIRAESGPDTVRAYRVTETKEYELTKAGPVDMRLARGLVLQDVAHRKREPKPPRIDPMMPVKTSTLDLAKKMRLYMIKPHMKEIEAQSIITQFKNNRAGFHKEYFANRKKES